MRIGIVTLCARRGEKRENLKKIVHFGGHAAERGCRLVVFPEYSVNGPWVTYDPAARLQDLQADAEPIEGPTTDLLASYAEQLGIAFCVGRWIRIRLQRWMARCVEHLYGDCSYLRRSARRSF